MGRPKNPPPSMPLFGEVPTLERARQLAARFPRGWKFQKMFRKCGGACCRRKGFKGHGPYVFARGIVNGKPVNRYVGTEARQAEIEAAWKLLAPELDAAAAVARAELEQLDARRREIDARRRELAPIAGVRRPRSLPDDVVSIPILKLGGGATRK